MSDSDRITEVIEPVPSSAAAAAAEPVATGGGSASEAAEASSAAAAAPTQTERKPGYVAITDVAGWIGAATKGFMLTPSDLRAIYMIVMWQFLNCHHIPEDGNLEGLPKIENDSTVQIPEKELSRIVGICLNPTFRAFFIRIVTL